MYGEKYGECQYICVWKIMTKKLSRDAWLNFSLKQLAQYGHGQLTANRLSSSLGVSRGSFYWHFKDIREFETSVLKRWEKITTDDIIENLRPLKNPRLRLSSLIKRSMDADMKLERAVRSWAISDQIVAEVVQIVDARRVAYIVSILRSLDVDEKDIKTRAQMLNWASIGRMMMSDRNDTALLSEAALHRFADLLVS